MTHITLDITSMSCAACATRVEKALAETPGVTSADVNYALERADLEIDETTDANALVAAVEQAGYGAILRSNDAAERQNAEEALDARHRAEARQTLLRFTISALFSVPLVIGMAPMMVGLGPALVGPWTQAVLAGGVMIASGSRFYREAFAALRGGGANMAVLVSLGTTVAFVWSLWLVVTGHGGGHLYFEAAAVVLTLVMLGKYLEARAKRGASAALNALGKLQPRTAERIGPQGPETIAVEELRLGDRILVRPGTRVPSDGTIERGLSSLDESLVTGESLPVERAQGDPVMTGTVNGSGPLEVLVTAIGADTTLAKMTRLVEEAQRGNAPVQRLVDRISAVFVPIIIVVAILTFAGWWLVAGDATTGLVSAVAVLVIACPCALGLATPTALVAGTGAAARAGILIRDIQTLETAGTIRRVAFDKTGTLTYGKPTVAAVDALAVNEQEMIAHAAAVEAGSEHPLGRALAEYAAATGAPPLQASNTQAAAGQGMTGTVAEHRVAVGNARLMEAEGIDATTVKTAGDALNGNGAIAYVAIDGRLSGTIVFADQPRVEAPAAIAALHAQNLETEMLTGDHKRAADAIAKQVGIGAVRAGLTPDEKVAAIRHEEGQASGIAFVGDGLNDGPALAAADLGIALSSGTDVAREAAAITLMRTDLQLVPASLAIARKTKRTITQNLVWAFIYNVIGIPLAAFGLLSPVFAGAAMAFSSVSVVTNSALLARWKPDIGSEKS